MARPRTGQLIWRASGWYARVWTTIDGERVRVMRALGTQNKAVAKRKLQKLLAADDATAVDTKAPETFAEAAERIYTAKMAARPAWAKEGLAGMRKHAVPVIGPLVATSVQTPQINAVLEHAREAGLARQSVRNLRQHLSNVFKGLRIEGAIVTNPVELATMPEFPAMVIKERAVLTDEELAIYLTYEPSDGRTKGATLERQVMACVARMFGGLRTGDLHALRWESFDVEDGRFTTGYAPRRKTRRPQLLEVPEMLRPFLRDWWQRAGKPGQGLLFPSRKGARAGEEKRGTSHADGFRRDLQAAFAAAVARGVEGVPKGPRAQKEGETLSAVARGASARWVELFEETEYTLPIDFHSLRRGYAQALADADVNAQQAAALTGHADMGAHMRYLRNAGKMRRLPAAALPQTAITVPNGRSARGSDADSGLLTDGQAERTSEITADVAHDTTDASLRNRGSKVRIFPAAQRANVAPQA